jgi:hypothetical protein
MQALKEVEKTFEIVDNPVSLTSNELSCSDGALLISEVMSECNRIIQERLLQASNTANPEFDVLSDLDAQVRKYVTADSDVGQLFIAAIDNTRTSYSKAANECAQEQNRLWVKLMKSLRTEFVDMTELVESTLPEKAIKAVRQIVFENSRRLSNAIEALDEPPATPLQPLKATKTIAKPINKFEAVKPVSPNRLASCGRPGSAYSVGRSKDNSYAKAFARHLDDPRQSHMVKGLFQ